VARLSRGPHDLADKTLRSVCTSSFIADAAGPKTQVVAGMFHDDKISVPTGAMALRALISLVFR
jgi:hypothetical protein